MTGLIGKMHFVDPQTHGFEYRLDFNDWWRYLGPKSKLYAEELARANSGSGMPQIDDLSPGFLFAYSKSLSPVDGGTLAFNGGIQNLSNMRWMRGWSSFYYPHQFKFNGIWESSSLAHMRPFIKPRF